MKQYCRYCCNACLNDDELAYCSYKDEMLDGPALRRLNHCKGFKFCEIDVLTQTRTYKPRAAKPPADTPEDAGQMGGAPIFYQLTTSCWLKYFQKLAKSYLQTSSKLV